MNLNETPPASHASSAGALDRDASVAPQRLGLCVEHALGCTRTPPAYPPSSKQAHYDRAREQRASRRKHLEG